MSTVGRTPAIVVTISALAATGSLVNVASSIFVLAFPLTPMRPDLNVAIPASMRDRAFVLVLAAALAAANGVALVHWGPRRAWPVLLLGGTVLTSASLLAEAESLADIPPDDWVLAAGGAGPVLLVIGLLGAANWLRYASAGEPGAAVAGATLGAPLLGTALLSVLARQIVIGTDMSATHTTHLVLAGVSIAGAVGALVVVLLPGGSPAPPRPSAGVTLAGVFGGFLLLAPDLFVQLVWSPEPLFGGSPADPALAGNDRWNLQLGLAGLVIVAVAVGLAAQLGIRALGGVLGTSLVLYGCAVPLAIAERSSHARTTLILALIGFLAGCLVAMTGWRVWAAGTACALAGITAIVTLAIGRDPTIGLAEVPVALAVPMVTLSVFAAVTAVATTTTVVTGHTQLPAMLGVIALVIQAGLIDASALLHHSAVLRSGWALDGPALAAGVALLLGGGLVVGARLMRSPDQAVLGPAVR